MCPRTQRTLLALNFKKIPGRTFLKNVVPKEHFFVASDIVPILFNKPCTCSEDNIFGRDYSNLNDLFQKY